MVRPNPHIPITDPPMRKNEMNTKLTEYQNQKIADVLCEMALCGETPDKIKEARRLLEKQMLKLNAISKLIPRF